MERPWPAHGLARPRSRHVPTVQRNYGKPLFFELIYCEIRLVMPSRLLRSLPLTIAEIPPEPWAKPEIIQSKGCRSHGRGGSSLQQRSNSIICSRYSSCRTESGFRTVSQRIENCGRHSQAVVVVIESSLFLEGFVRLTCECSEVLEECQVVRFQRGVRMGHSAPDVPA